MQSLLASTTSHREWMVAVIETLARLESPSTDKVALDRCASELARLIVELGGHVMVLPRADGGDHLRAEFGRGDAQILLLGHFDTVWPVGQVAHMPVRRDVDRIYGPGVYDMKAGIAIALAAIRSLIEIGRFPPHRVVLLLTSDDEVGSTSTRTIIEVEARQSRAVLVMEPSLPGGGVKTARKGVGDFRIEATGVAAHAGIQPERGASAVHELAWQVGAVLALADPDCGLTINVGTFRGGERSNVVAASARMEVDVRFSTMAAAERINAGFAALAPRDPRVKLEVRGGVNRPPLERTPGVVALYMMARDIARACGRSLDEGSTGGGSDGNFTAALGVPTLDGLGAEGDGAHALHEHVLIEPLPFRAALVAGIISQLQ